MKPYTISSHSLLSLFGFTVIGWNEHSFKKKSQQEIHEWAYDYINSNFTPKMVPFEPAKLFLLEVAKPDQVPTKEEFTKWQEKRKIVEALK